MSSNHFYRRDLPYYREENAVYFITWRVMRGVRDLELSERTIVSEAIHHFAGIQYELFAFVVMNDHVHLVMRPLDGRKLESIVQSRKSYTSNVIQKGRRSRGQLWLHEYFDRIVRDEKELEQKRGYILRNPFTRWPELESYQWLWPQPDY